MNQADLNMEDVDHLNPSTPDGRPNAPTNIEFRFRDICKNGLSLDGKTTIQAIKMFKEIKHLLLSNISTFSSGTPEQVEMLWFAFILYSVKRLCECTHNSNKPSYESGFTLCQILRVTNLNIVDFFKELPQFVLKVDTILSNLHGSNWEKKLEAKEVQTNFVHLSVLSKYYKDAFQNFFVTRDVSDNNLSQVSSAIRYVSEYYRFGWLLFLALRIHAFSTFKDLVTCTNGLISVLAILIIHAPIHFRKFTIHDSKSFIRNSGKGVDVVASLCNIYNTSEDQLKETLEKVNIIIVNILKKKSSTASECRTGNLEYIDPDGLIYFEDLMEESSLSLSINILEKDYTDATYNKAAFDERIFVNEEDSLFGSGSLSGGAMHLDGAKECFQPNLRTIDSIPSITTVKTPMSPQHSPSTCEENSNTGITNAKMRAPTPVSTAMTTAKWLRTVITPLPSKPLPELEKFLSSCDRDVSSEVTCRAYIILEAIFPTNVQKGSNLIDNIWAMERRMEAVKLYYRVLESMCRAEVQIFRANNLTSLLTNETFHRCMLACSAELVLSTHKAVTMLFPAVLERSGISAFDLSKVIESFIRHEESLPRELRRYLNSLEERILQSMVWEKGSSLYNSLIVARPGLSTEINHLGLLAEPMSSLDEITKNRNNSCGSLTPFSLQKDDVLTGQNVEYRSPKRVCSDYRSVLVEQNTITSAGQDRFTALNNFKPKLPPLQSTFGSPTRPNLGGGTCAETGISIFFSKIVKLAAIRISGLVERLQLSLHMRESVYHLVQLILNHRTALFFNRHIDQIILCSFYGVAKISQMRLTFREIIQNYRKQPNCKPYVFRNVFVDWSSTSSNGKTGKEHVDIITFYNQVFIPAAKSLLLELDLAGTNTDPTWVADTHSKNNDESPKIAPFPSLPDMSPKKVSATHNVYVSPLRPLKMDDLISHGTKSYYACVGESTRAYQSPWKDLTAINDQLNVNSQNPDDNARLVSDSLVAKSLCIQTGKGAPLKSEQPDL